VGKGAFRRTIVVLLLWAAAVSAAGPGKEAGKGGGDLTALLADLGKKASDFQTLATDFTQEKKMAMFREKLVIKGRIRLQKPNKIAWHVDSPLRYSVLITDKSIRQWDEDTDRIQEISLSGNPVFRNVLNQLTVWFSGDYGSLIDGNDVRLVGEAPLSLEFVPRDNNIAKKIIRSITITFRDDRKYLRQIRILETSGDETVIRFSETRLNPPLDRNSFEVKGGV
jgi:outer membrane lipoprotein-sorting protein